MDRSLRVLVSTAEHLMSMGGGDVNHALMEVMDCLGHILGRSSAEIALHMRDGNKLTDSADFLRVETRTSDNKTRWKIALDGQVTKEVVAEEDRPDAG